MNTKKFLIVMILGVLCASCSSIKTVSYFQDVSLDTIVENAPDRFITLKPDDKISVIVSTKDPLLDDRFNIMASVRNITGTIAGDDAQSSAYRVDPEGYIMMPELGRIYVEGKSRDQVREEIRKRLIDDGYVSDPVVTIDFVNLTFTVLGEVKSPGIYHIDRDQISIIDAIGMAGDMSIYGLRSNVKLMRMVDGKTYAYVVDFTNLENLYSSPAFYLEQNDTIYIEPNDMRIRQSTVNGNNLFSVSFWMTLSSFFLTTALLFL